MTALTWYLARATGIVAWGLLTLSVLLGLVLSTRALGRTPGPRWWSDLHAHASTLALSFTGLHLSALLVDTYVEFDLVDLVVPFTSSWRPVPVALGVIALWAIVAVQVTTVLRKRIGTTAWRRWHALAWPAWAMATFHLVTAGTDATHPALAGAALASLIVVPALTLARVWGPRGVGRAAGRPARRATADS